MIRYPLSFLLICIVFFSHLSSPFALTIGVPGGKPTIQAGIDAASPGDTVLVQPGTYYEVIDFKGKNIVVGSMWLATKDSSYIINTIIDATQRNTVVAFQNGETEKAELCGFTITHGKSQADIGKSGNIGGGIFCKNASPYLHHLIVENNLSNLEGGGMYLEKSNSVIEYCVIRNNRAVISGGGIDISQGNHQISNCIIDNNKGTGGGIFCNNSKVRMYKVLMIKNTNDAYQINRSDINIINCIIANHGSYAFQIFYSKVNIINSIFWNSSPQIRISDSPSEHPELPISRITVAFSDIKGGKDAILIAPFNLIFYENNIENDPLFKNFNSGDYSLNKGSPCIDKGTAFYTFSDSVVVNIDRNYYKGNAPDMGAFESDYPLSVANDNIASKIYLSNFPNPFNSSISIEFKLPMKSKVNLSVFSITGQKVYELVSNILPAGRHIYQWKGENMTGMKVSSGVYIVRLKGEIFFQTKRVIFLK